METFNILLMEIYILKELNYSYYLINYDQINSGTPQDMFTPNLTEYKQEFISIYKVHSIYINI
jgi:hypothetical protein